MRFKKTGSNTSNKSSVSTVGGSVIGLSIGQNLVSMVQVSGKRLDQVQVEKYATVQLPTGVISGSEIVDFENLVSHLQQCYRKMKTNCKRVNIGLPASAVTIEDNLQYYSDSDISVQEFVETEVVRVGALDEMRYDWHEFEQKGGEAKTVLMVAAKIADVDRYTDLLDELDLNAANVDVDIFAVANAFSYADQMDGGEFAYEKIGMFDIGDSVTKTLVMSGGRILFRHESPLGLTNLLQMIQHDYQVSEVEAMRMLAGETPQPEGFKASVIDNFNMQVVQEIQRALQFFATTQNIEQGDDLKRIFVSGSGCVAGSGLAQAVHAQTGILTSQVAPVTVANSKLKVDEHRFAADANALTTAFGLALRGLA